MRKVVIEKSPYRFERERHEWVRNPRRFPHMSVVDYWRVVRKVPWARDYQWHVSYFRDSIVVKVTNIPAV